MEKYTDAEIAFILESKESKGLSWSEIANKFNKKFNKQKSYGSMETCYRRYKELFSEDKNYIEVLKKSERQRRANGINSKENKLLVDSWIKREDLLEEIKEAIKGINKVKPPAPLKKDKKKSNMTMELLLSDIHVGKITDTFNHEVLQRRLDQIVSVVIKEFKRNSVHYNVERLIISFIGDLMESSSIHGSESRRGCEFGDAKQVSESIRLFYSKVIAPLHALGIKIDCVGVTGNHDRIGEHKTYHKPGEESFTYITYHALKLLCETAGLKNLTWTIPVMTSTILDVYGEKVLYDHYDSVKGGDLRKGLETLLAKRIKQLNTPIHFMRGGHFHEPMEIGIGKIIINGSAPGNDSYSDILGYACEPSQTLNMYIQREKSDSVKRMTSFYKRLLIQLD